MPGAQGEKGKDSHDGNSRTPKEKNGSEREPPKRGKFLDCLCLQSPYGTQFDPLSIVEPQSALVHALQEAHQSTPIQMVLLLHADQFYTGWVGAAPTGNVKHRISPSSTAPSKKSKKAKGTCSF